MSDSKHTPGPWTIVEEPRTPQEMSVRSRDFQSDMMGDYRGVIICDFGRSTGGREHARPEAQANALLISAAPDLLAACEEVVTWCLVMKSKEAPRLDRFAEGDDWCECATCQAAVRRLAAIKKARGA